MVDDESAAFNGTDTVAGPSATSTASDADETPPALTGPGRGPAGFKRIAPTIAALVLIVAFSMGMYFVYQNASIIVNVDNLSGTAAFEGRVLVEGGEDGDDLVGLPNATVTVKGTEVAVTTNATGYYKIEECPRGLQTIRIAKHGYRTTDKRFVIVDSSLYDKALLVPADWIGTAPALPTQNLTGRVLADTTPATPVGNATVTLTALANAQSYQSRTTADGQFEMTRVTNGVYNCTITAPNASGGTDQNGNHTIGRYRLLVSPANHNVTLTVNRTAGTSQNGTVTDLVPRLNLTGRVTDDDGGPIMNASVHAVAAGNGLLTTASTDENGEYRIIELAAGVYNLSATADGYKVRYYGNTTLNATATSATAEQSFEIELGTSYWRDEVALQQWMVCVVLTAVFSTFALLGAILALRRKNYSIAVVCALVGAMSTGPFCSINLFLGVIGFLLILYSRTEFD